MPVDLYPKFGLFLFGWLSLHHLPGDFLEKEHWSSWCLGIDGIEICMAWTFKCEKCCHDEFCSNSSFSRKVMHWLDWSTNGIFIYCFVQRSYYFLFFYFLIFSFSILVSFFWFDFHSDIRKNFRVKFCIVFGSSLHSLIGFFLHFRRCNRSYLCESYRSDNVLGVLKACHPNHHIQIFV